MKERPILFSAAMVRAIRAGTKSQTRRIVAPQPGPASHSYFDEPGGWWVFGDNSGRTYRCPYGLRGDRLWVREAWWKDRSGGLAGYAADCHPEGPENTVCKHAAAIHMPRWASRLTLEVVQVRAQRLHEITEEEARAEGAAPQGFASLWEEIHGQGAWEANPWVWAVSFRPIHIEQRAGEQLPAQPETRR